jgi:hypothetical protein
MASMIRGSQIADLEKKLAEAPAATIKQGAAEH